MVIFFSIFLMNKIHSADSFHVFFFSISLFQATKLTNFHQQSRKSFPFRASIIMKVASACRKIYSYIVKKFFSQVIIFFCQLMLFSSLQMPFSSPIGISLFVYSLSLLIFWVPKKFACVPILFSWFLMIFWDSL